VRISLYKSAGSVGRYGGQTDCFVQCNAEQARDVGDYRSCRPAASAAGSSIWNKRSEGRKLRCLLWVDLQGHKPVDSESESNGLFFTISLYRCRFALPLMTSLRSLFIYAPILFFLSSSALISVVIVRCAYWLLPQIADSDSVHDSLLFSL